LARFDRRHFEVILKAASGEVVLSRSRRTAQGSRVGRSPLLQDRPEVSLSRDSGVRPAPAGVQRLSCSWPFGFGVLLSPK
jgi:hypothetical protein